MAQGFQPRAETKLLVYENQIQQEKEDVSANLIFCGAQEARFLFGSVEAVVKDSQNLYRR